MSGAEEVRTTLLPARAIEARAAGYLQRRHFGDWMEKDQADLENWLAESSVHLVTYLRLEAAWSRSERLIALHKPQRNEAGAPSRKRMLRNIAGVVAIGVAVLSAAGWQYFSAAQGVVYTTAVGAHRIVTLADNSVVELNTDTVLRLRGRTAELDRGEAYFQIKHDAAHPFVVLAGNHRITDLGTKFVVRSAAAHLEVMLVEGKARVDSTGFGKSVQSANLLPGDIAVATASAITVAKKPMQEVSDSLGWRRGLLTFKHATLAEAAAEFNRYNVGKLIITDPHLGDRKIVGTFQARNVGLFAEVMQELLGLRVSKTGEDTVISR